MGGWAGGRLGRTAGGAPGATMVRHPGATRGGRARSQSVPKACAPGAVLRGPHPWVKTPPPPLDQNSIKLPAPSTCTAVLLITRALRPAGLSGTLSSHLRGGAALVAPPALAAGCCGAGMGRRRRARAQRGAGPNTKTPGQPGLALSLAAASVDILWLHCPCIAMTAVPNPAAAAARRGAKPGGANPCY